MTTWALGSWSYTQTSANAPVSSPVPLGGGLGSGPPLLPAIERAGLLWGFAEVVS